MTRIQPERLIPKLRCPFCHGELEPTVLKRGCGVCMAWHHPGCWDEHGSCSACGHVERERAPKTKTRRQEVKTSLREPRAIQGVLPHAFAGPRFGESVGMHVVPGTLEGVAEKLNLMLAAAECEAQTKGNWISFRARASQGRHPMKGGFILEEHGSSRVEIRWFVRPTPGIATAWAVVVAVLFCWSLIVPFGIRRVLVDRPRDFVRRLLAQL